MIQNIGQVAVTVSNLEEAMVFYRDMIGLPFLMQAGHMAFFQCGGVRIMLSLPEHGVGTLSSVLYFRVADIQQAHQQLAGVGVPFDGEPHLIAKMPDHDLWMAFFRDPSGNVMALMSEVRAKE